MQRYTDDNEAQLEGDTVDMVVEALIIVGIAMLCIAALAWFGGL